MRSRVARGLSKLGDGGAQQFVKFCSVGALGLAVNLSVYTLALDKLGLVPLVAATIAFTTTVSQNYVLNRYWTFRGGRGSFAAQGLRFAVVSLCSLGLNGLLLTALLALAVSKIPAQAIAIALVAPASFLGNRGWSFVTPHGHQRPTHEPLPARPSLCVCVPTYNEAENVEPLVRDVLRTLDRLELPGAVLLIDDGSPDGTGEIADALAAVDARVAVLHRREKNGLGAAYKAGFEWALQRDFDLVVEMDCDFSHDPASLEALVAAARHADLVLGSRYVSGGRVEGWPLVRRVISRGGSLYSRVILGLPVRDVTGGFKCFRRSALERLAFGQAEARGYGFQIEMTYRALRGGLEVVESPIVFRNRVHGQSKMTGPIAFEAAKLVLKLRFSPDLPLRNPRAEQRLLPLAST